MKKEKKSKNRSIKKAVNPKNKKSTFAPNIKGSRSQLKLAEIELTPAEEAKKKKSKQNQADQVENNKSEDEEEDSDVEKESKKAKNLREMQKYDIK